MSSRPYNFSAGPAVLPDSVLQTIQDELFDWCDGMSVMEISHRSDAFVAMTEQSVKTLRELMKIPDDYAVLFMHGGATGQFASVPMNLLRGKKKADYINTGIWSKKAIVEAKKYCDVNVAASDEAAGYVHIPDFSSWKLNDDAAYLHYTPNETVNGVEFHWVPKVNVPLVADMSSCILSRPVDISQFDLIYAGAQKNMGPSGIVLVIVRKDLIGDAIKETPSILDYKATFDNASIYNTPATFAWYVCNLMFDWVKAQGGVEKLGLINQKKSELLYSTIDGSDFYKAPVKKSDRSRMNVPFSTKDESLNKKFLQEAAEHGLQQLEGHRSVGGMRASIYNAMPLEGVQALVNFMKDFAQRNA